MSKDRRPYIAVAQELFRHPKWRRISKDARLWLLELWGYCNEFRTDGMVHRSVLEEEGTKVAAELLSANWVEVTADPDEFYMHDYLAHQPSASEIEERMAANREASARGGKKASHTRWHVNRGIIDPNCDLCPGAEPDL